MLQVKLCVYGKSSLNHVGVEEEGRKGGRGEKGGRKEGRRGGGEEVRRGGEVGRRGGWGGKGEVGEGYTTL